jgi:hypothetical protein
MEVKRPDGGTVRVEPLENKCRKCDGCGQIASSEDGEPWTVWQNLPPGSDAAVRLGLVKPIPCPGCGGTGVKKAL